MSKLLLLALIALPLNVNAETYTINGAKDKTKRDAIVALASNKSVKVEKCAYKEEQDSNKGSVICKPVELGPRGNIRLIK